MATATVPSFLESSELQLDDLLMRICAELQLDDTRHQRAEASYGAVAQVLEADAVLRNFRPTLYPQGSMALRTTVRPLAGDEFDLDCVCEFDCDTAPFRNPVHALDLVEQALRANKLYNGMVERKNRCIRLNYRGKFHLDILPACRDLEKGGTCILVADRRLKQFVPSNPKGFVLWLNERARQLTLRELLGKAQPLPEKQEASEKPPLKLGIQLLKRRRDIRYKSNPELAPPSIVLTALSGELYRGEQSVAVTLANVLAGIAVRIQAASPRLVVLNPSNPGEDLSERWDANPWAYRSFVDSIEEFQAQWKSLMLARGIDKSAQFLERLFGEGLAKQVIENQARDIEAARSRNSLSVKKGSGLLTGLATASAVPVRRNTFYGSEK